MSCSAELCSSTTEAFYRVAEEVSVFTAHEVTEMFQKNILKMLPWITSRTLLTPPTGSTVVRCLDLVILLLDLRSRTKSGMIKNPRPYEIFSLKLFACSSGSVNLISWQWSCNRWSVAQGFCIRITMRQTDHVSQIFNSACNTNLWL